MQVGRSSTPAQRLGSVHAVVIEDHHRRECNGAPPFGCVNLDELAAHAGALRVSSGIGPFDQTWSITMKRFILIAALATVTTTAQAEEFSGKCTDYATGKDACQATQWCAWREGRTVSLPDGQSVQTKGSCAFKPHHREAWVAKTAQATKPQ
jgi:hypothetical protein